MNKLFAFFLSLALTVASVACKHDTDVVVPDGPGSPIPGQPTPDRPGKVCPAGTPIGEVTTKTIGPEGGELVAAELGIRISVPAGAVASAQPFSVQPIGSTGPQALGMGFRLAPHGITFKKPVTITVRYDPETLPGTVPDVLALAYQNSRGVWVLAAKGNVDTTAHTVSVETTHFSDWNLLQRAVLTPETGFVRPGGNLVLSVKILAGDVSAPLPGEEEVPEPYESPEKAVNYSTWNLSGEGKLTPASFKASYDAPNAPPARNPVAVSIKLRGPAVVDGKPYKELWLVSNIYIAQEGLTYRINKGKWIHTTASALGAAFVSNGYLFLSTGTAKEGNLGVTIITPKPTYALGDDDPIQFSPTRTPWSAGAQPTTFNLSDYTSGTLHLHYYKQKVSTGTLNISSFGPVGSWVIGSFELDAAGILHPTNGFTGTAQIEGFFKLPRSRNLK
ncbi:hypothetical protein [Spirosoma areae]